jgi:hypothetical protein
MINQIPGTDLLLPSVWQLLRTGLSPREWIAKHYGRDAVHAWEAAGRPEWVDPFEAPPSDQGVVRRGWQGHRRQALFTHPSPKHSQASTGTH